MGVFLIDPATGVQVSVSEERAIALGWPTPDGTTYAPAPAVDEAAPVAEPVEEEPAKPRRTRAKAKAKPSPQADETW